MILHDARDEDVIISNLDEKYWPELEQSELDGFESVLETITYNEFEDIYND